MNNETISLNGLDDSPLKTSLGQLVTHIYNLEEKVQHYQNEIEEHEAHSEQLENDVETLLAENEKLKKERDDFEVQWHKSLEGQVDLEEENKKLKEKNEDLNRRFNDVNYVPENNYTEKAILEFIESCPIKVLKKINQSNDSS